MGEATREKQKVDESNRTQVITKQGTTGVTKSKIGEKKNQHVARSTSDPDMLKEINGIGSGLVIQLEGELEEIVCFRRYVRGYRRLS